MLKVIDKYFPKKFSTKVLHYSKYYYAVYYCYYRIIPIWYPLYYWFDLGHPDDNACWSIRLWDVKTAEHVASSLKTIEDVSIFYKPENEKEQKWKINEIEYWKINVPYKSKKF